MKRILLIDDHEELRAEMANVLELEGFTVDQAANGRLGLARINAQRPDIVICDLVMPDMDGYETLQAIRGDADLETLPFLMLTARDEREQMRHGMEMGADDYITKPFKVGDLLRAVHAAVDKIARLERHAQAKLEHLREQVATTLPHELRTPLACIMGYAEMLAEAEGSGQAHDVTALAEQILGAGQRLHRISENALLFLQLEMLGRGRGDVRADARPIRTSLSEIVVRHARSVAAAHSRAQDLVLDLGDATVAVYAAYVAKIVDELVDNAFKFSPAGTPVRVSTSMDGARVALHVSDAGSGMAEEQVAAIGGFVQFERSVREQQGVGLGLSIASRVAQVWGGALSIASAPGSGTIVTVRLPPGEATAAHPDES
jgi:signal transduction histidine kinase